MQTPTQPQERRTRETATKTVFRFLPRVQRYCINSGLRGEERAGFEEIMERIRKVISEMSGTYESENLAEEKRTVGLHYFGASFDAWIVELDTGDINDTHEQWMSQCYGLVKFSGSEAEMGYLSIPEIINAGMELDLYWQPTTLAEVKRKLERGAR